LETAYAKKTEPWPDAACKDADIDPFFSFEEGEKNKAKQLCSQCPVREECLDYALKTHILDGVWGGLDTDERKRLHRKNLERRRRVA